jgi:hypothetical protein
MSESLSLKEIALRIGNMRSVVRDKHRRVWLSPVRIVSCQSVCLAANPLFEIEGDKYFQ